MEEVPLNECKGGEETLHYEKNGTIEKAEEVKFTPSDSVATTPHKKAIEKTIGLPGALSMIVGVMIGSGIFASPKTVFDNAGSVGMGLVVWAGCGVLATLGSLCYAELGTMIQESGGERAYLAKIFGAPVGFLFSWTAVIVIKPSTIAGISMAFAQYVLEPFFPGDAGSADLVWANKLLAFGAILVLFTVNSVTIKGATRTQIVFTVAKLIALVMLIITGFVRLGQGHTASFENSFKGTNSRISKIGYAFYGGLWAFDGWNNLNYMTEELKNPIRDLPLSIMIGIPLVTMLYILTNIAYLTVLSGVQIAKQTAVAVSLANQLYGKAAFIIPVLVACSTFGAANGSIFSASRIVYTTAREGWMPRIFGTIQRKFRSPMPAMFFECFIACLMLMPDSSNFETIIKYFNFAAWTFYGMTMLALLWARYKYPDWERPYRVFIGIPIFVFICAIYLVSAPIYDYPLESFVCLLFILLGLPIYFLFVYKDILPTAAMKAIDKLQEFVEKGLGLVISVDDDETEKIHKDAELAGEEADDVAKTLISEQAQAL